MQADHVVSWESPTLQRRGLRRTTWRARAPTTKPAQRRERSFPDNELRPTNITILKQRNQIIRDCANDRILEIHNTDRTIVLKQQVARMVIPMHHHLWLFKC